MVCRAVVLTLGRCFVDAGNLHHQLAQQRCMIHCILDTMCVTRSLAWLGKHTFVVLCKLVCVAHRAVVLSDG